MSLNADRVEVLEYDDSPGHLSSDSNSLDDDILRSVDAFSDYEEDERMGFTYDKLLQASRGSVAYRASLVDKNPLNNSLANRKDIRLYSVDNNTFP